MPQLLLRALELRIQQRVRQFPHRRLLCCVRPPGANSRQPRRIFLRLGRRPCCDMIDDPRLARRTVLLDLFLVLRVRVPFLVPSLEAVPRRAAVDGERAAGGVESVGDELPVKGELVAEPLKDDVVVGLPDRGGKTGLVVSRLGGLDAGGEMRGVPSFLARKEGWKDEMEGVFEASASLQSLQSRSKKEELTCSRRHWIRLQVHQISRLLDSPKIAQILPIVRPFPFARLECTDEHGPDVEQPTRMSELAAARRGVIDSTVDSTGENLGLGERDGHSVESDVAEEVGEDEGGELGGEGGGVDGGIGLGLSGVGG
jgi:hypothetical protein